MQTKSYIFLFLGFCFFSKINTQILVSNDLVLSDELAKILKQHHLIFRIISEKENARIEKKHNKTILFFQEKYGVNWRDSIINIIQIERDDLFLKLNCYKEISIHSTETKHYRHTEIHFDKNGMITKKRQQIRYNKRKRIYKTWCFNTEEKLEKKFKEVSIKKSWG